MVSSVTTATMLLFSAAAAQAQIHLPDLSEFGNSSFAQTVGHAVFSGEAGCPFHPLANETACLWTGDCSAPGCDSNCVENPALILHAYDDLVAAAVEEVLRSSQCAIVSSLFAIVQSYMGAFGSGDAGTTAPSSFSSDAATQRRLLDAQAATITDHFHRRLFHSSTAATTPDNDVDGTVQAAYDAVSAASDENAYFPPCPERSQLDSYMIFLPMLRSYLDNSNDTTLTTLRTLADSVPMLEHLFYSATSEEILDQFYSDCASLETTPNDELYQYYAHDTSLDTTMSVCRPVDGSDLSVLRPLWMAAHEPSCSLTDSAPSPCTSRPGIECIAGIYEALNYTAPRDAMSNVYSTADTIYQECSLSLTEADCMAVDLPEALDTLTQLGQDLAAPVQGNDALAADGLATESAQDAPVSGSRAGGASMDFGAAVLTLVAVMLALA